MTNAQTSNFRVGDTWIPNPPGIEYHRELGKLLGYSDEEIEEFILKLRQ